MMAFSCLSLSTLQAVAVALSLYAIRRIRYCMPVLAVLCWRLNQYCMYLANEVIPVWM
jgi:hypothetical protein